MQLHCFHSQLRTLITVKVVHSGPTVNWKGQHLDSSFTSSSEIKFNISKSRVFMHMAVLQALVIASGDAVNRVRGI